MKHQCVLFSGLVTSGIVILLFLAGCRGGTAATGAGGKPMTLDKLLVLHSRLRVEFYESDRPADRLLADSG